MDYYLFFKPADAANLIDVLRPRKRPGKQRKLFRFEPRFEERYGDLAFFVMDEAQRTRIRGETRGAIGERQAIYSASNMVTADLVDYTSKKLEEGVRAFRADFYRPASKKFFAYATPYPGSGRFKEQMRAQKNLDLERLRFVDYDVGDPISSAIKGTFSTFELALLNSPAFVKYQRRGLALIVPGKLINRK